MLFRCVRLLYAIYTKVVAVVVAVAVVVRSGLQSLTVGSQPLGDEAASCMFVHGALSVPHCMHEDGTMSVPHRRLWGCALVFCCGAADHAPCQRGASASMLLLA